MKIKRLEICGFKSFIEKTVLVFPEGVTAVVGPNGCGKSNIVDAIRWVMGEQSAKNLRGRYMEDVIFGGSESRKPLGMAEVTLFFSTEDGRIPAKYLNYTEIQVTRRLFRDGESEYLLNRTPCRLMDIAELFMDTGIGARAYSIIEQGRIGMILMAKPEERRFLIEDAAGVTKYKSRKQVALKKLEVTRQNLLRIGDIVTEIRRQLNSLHRQAKKAERFRSLRDELKDIDVLFAKRRFTLLSEERNQLMAAYGKLKDHESAVTAALELHETRLEERRIQLLEEEQKLTTAQEDIFQGKSELQGEQNKLEFQNKEIQNLERQLVRSREELLHLEQQMVKATSERQLLESKNSEFENVVSVDGLALERSEVILEGLLSAERVISSRLEENRRILFELLNEINQASNQQLVAGRRLENLAERSERSNREELTIREKVQEVSKRRALLEHTLNEITTARGCFLARIAELEQTELRQKVSLQKLDKDLQEGRDEASRISSRLASMKEFDQQLAGVGKGVRTLLFSEDFKSRFAGIFADFVEVEDGYEAALEAVMGERLQLLPAKGKDDILAAVAYLKTSSGGRCGFLLPEGINSASLELPEGGIPLLSKIKFADSIRELFEPLLCRAMLTSDLENAITLAQIHTDLTFVTMDGDIVSPDGVIEAGSIEPASKGLLHKKREIKELSLLESRQLIRIKELIAQKDLCLAEIAFAGETLIRLRQEVHLSEMSLLAHEKDLNSIDAEAGRLEERLSIKYLEDEQLIEEKTALETEVSTASEKRLAFEARKGDLETEVVTLQQALALKGEEITLAREVVTATKVREAALRERQEAAKIALKRIDDLQQDLSGRMARHTDEIIAIEVDLERIRSELEITKGMLNDLITRQATREEVLSEIRDHYESFAAVVREEESGIRASRASVDDLRGKIAEVSLNLSGQAMELGHLEETLRDKYRLEITSILTGLPEIQADDVMLKLRQTELQKLVDDMGEVNLTAIDEYHELEQRHTFLSEQKMDLEESLKSLSQAIQRINRTTRKRFLETFQLVNEKFQAVFPRLFCGGKGELKLTNEEDLLETGLDIIVQPPGKKLQNVSLLSGGEKALTAVALIFSIFLIKPSPFCLLDEVDAPLDDANIGRFNEMIREMTAFSQFILITHSKTTMAVADTLYGVTMEEPGVSKLVSVKLQ